MNEAATAHPRGETIPTSSLPPAMSSALRDVEGSGRRKLITRDGTPIAVLLGMDEYRQLEADAWAGRLARELQEAQAEIERGGGIPHEHMLQEFEARWGKPLRRR